MLYSYYYPTHSSGHSIRGYSVTKLGEEEEEEEEEERHETRMKTVDACFLFVCPCSLPPHSLCFQQRCLVCHDLGIQMGTERGETEKGIGATVQLLARTLTRI